MKTDLQTNIRKLMQEHHVPATSVAIIENGTIETQLFGVVNAKTKQAITPETVFQAASITKPVFAYVAMTLVQQGILDLKKPLSDYMPEPYIPDEPRLNAITAHHVLCHTTGFPNWRRDKPLTINFTPGERWSYSGEGYVYLQKVVEHVTEKSFTELADEFVFEPLDMTRSHLFWVADDYRGTAALPHDENGNVVDDTPHKEANAAYSMYTTPTDIAKFMLHTFEPTTITQDMLTQQVNVNSLVPWHEDWPDGEYEVIENVGWGLGWALQQLDDEKYLWHWGDNGTFQCFAIGNTAKKSGVVVMTNGQNGRSVYMPIIEAIMGGKQPALDWLKRTYA